MSCYELWFVLVVGEEEKCREVVPRIRVGWVGLVNAGANAVTERGGRGANQPLGG